MRPSGTCCSCCSWQRDSIGRRNCFRPGWVLSADESSTGPSLVPAALVVGLCAVGFTTVNLHRASFFSAWSDPNAPVKRVAHGLEVADVRAGYADYWVAYDLDFQSGGRLEITTVPGDPDPWPTLNREVLHSRETAWLFIKHVRLAETQSADTGRIRGPVGLAEPSSSTSCGSAGRGYSEVYSGTVIAVIPRKRVVPTEVDL